MVRTFQLTLATLVLLTGCGSPAPKPTPQQQEFFFARERPEDLTGKILDTRPRRCACGRTSDKFPGWLKKNYPAWVRYAYDREKDAK